MSSNNKNLPSHGIAPDTHDLVDIDTLPAYLKLLYVVSWLGVGTLLAAGLVAISFVARVKGGE